MSAVDSAECARPRRLFPRRFPLGFRVPDSD